MKNDHDIIRINADENASLIVSNKDEKHKSSSMTSASYESIGKSIKIITKTALPMMCTQAISEVTLIGGSIMLSYVDRDTLTSVGLIFPILNMLLYPLSGPLFSVNILSSQAYGASLKDKSNTKELEKIGNIFQMGNIVAIISSVIPITLSLTIGPILCGCGQDANISSIVGSFFKAFAWGIPAKYLLLASQQFADAVNKQHITAIFSFASLPVLVGVGYYLTFGWPRIGIPRLGAPGYGYGLAAQSWANFLSFEAYLLFRKEFKKYKLLFLQHVGRRDIMREIYKLGGPIIFHIGSELSAVVVISLLAGWLGKDALASQGIATQYLLFTLIIILSFQSTGRALLGRLFGEGKVHLLRRYNNILMAGGLLVSSIPLAISLIIPKYLAMPFTNVDDPENASMLQSFSSLAPYVMAGILPEALRLINVGACQGMRDSFVPTLLCLLPLWLIGLPLEYVFGFTLAFGIDGVAGARAISLLTSGTLLIWRFIRQSKLVISASMLPANSHSVNAKLSSSLDTLFNQNGSVNNNKNNNDDDDEVKVRKSRKCCSLWGKFFSCFTGCGKVKSYQPIEVNRSIN